MKTCRDIISLAMTLGRIIPIGDEPTDDEAELGLTILQGMYDSFFADGMFGRLNDVYAADDYDAVAGDRIYANEFTVTIPTDIDDQDIFNDLKAITVITNGTAFNHVFSGGAWEKCSGLTLNDPAPLESRGSDGLACLLASYMVEAFGGQLAPFQMRRAGQFRTGLAAKFGSTQSSTAPSYY